MTDQPTTADDHTVYSMTAPRQARTLPRTAGPFPVTVWGHQPGGIPDMIAKGAATLGHDGCGTATITAADGTRYASTQTAWDPTAHHWNSTARRLDPEHPES